MTREIDINGKKYPIRFTIAGLEEYADLVGVPFDMITAKIHPTKLFYIGLKWGCKREGKDFPFSLYETGVIFEEQGMVGDELMEWLNDDLAGYSEKAKKKREEMEAKAKEKEKEVLEQLYPTSEK